jgi:hypothetical protein
VRAHLLELTATPFNSSKKISSKIFGNPVWMVLNVSPESSDRYTIPVVCSAAQTLVPLTRTRVMGLAPVDGGGSRSLISSQTPTAWLASPLGGTGWNAGPLPAAEATCQQPARHISNVQNNLVQSIFLG